MGNLQLWVIGCLLVMVNAFGGSEDRFVKKYAMMKIYESCFGPEVLRQIRKEMKDACAKCAAYDSPPPSTTTTTHSPPHATEEPPQGDAQPPGPHPSGLDVEKLHQAIMAFRPNMQQPQFRPASFPGQGGAMGNQFYSPMAFSNPNYQPPGNYPFFYQPGYQQIPFSPYGNFFGQQFYGGNSRVSRDMDMRSQLEAITSKMSGKTRNVTCVMQELGYLDENLEPNYSKISERIANLPVEEELRKDMQDGVTYCQQFSQCVPEVKNEKSPLSRELIRPMFFFKCYKHKKLEACVMKDVRKKYVDVASDSSDDLEEDFGSRRGKSANVGNGADEELAASLYDFLYMGDGEIF
ncbi:uncharacterized protein LOC126740777 [Anthonomus grandis grandis]|uniref:uncharacterized protein LOC126740777 n=1 Tax=Anthonomus grandis grandis TaxID=2921223 RepID=UPI0021652E5A|nr:uncharacterized protein LOC126740777 [Anthonomus grandis grandis]